MVACGGAVLDAGGVAGPVKDGVGVKVEVGVKVDGVGV